MVIKGVAPDGEVAVVHDVERACTHTMAGGKHGEDNGDGGDEGLHVGR